MFLKTKIELLSDEINKEKYPFSFVIVPIVEPST